MAQRYPPLPPAEHITHSYTFSKLHPVGILRNQLLIPPAAHRPTRRHVCTHVPTTNSTTCFRDTDRKTFDRLHSSWITTILIFCIPSEETIHKFTLARCQHAHLFCPLRGPTTTTRDSNLILLFSVFRAGVTYSGTASNRGCNPRRSIRLGQGLLCFGVGWIGNLFGSGRSSCLCGALLSPHHHPTQLTNHRRRETYRRHYFDSTRLPRSRQQHTARGRRFLFPCSNNGMDWAALVREKTESFGPPGGLLGHGFTKCS